MKKGMNPDENSRKNIHSSVKRERETEEEERPKFDAEWIRICGFLREERKVERV